MTTSHYPKFLFQFTTVQHTLAWKEGVGGATAKSCNVAAGTYSTIFAYLSALDTAIGAVTAGAHSITCSSTGLVVINIANATVQNWSGCTAALKTLLGFAGTETFVATATATLRHQQGWYPGTISYGVTSGAGPRSDSGWYVGDEATTVFAATGAGRSLAPTRRLYLRELSFGPISALEMRRSQLRGPISFEDRWAVVPFRWYPNREAGTVASPGTQMDPGSTAFDIDYNHDFWLVTLADDADVSQSSGAPDWLGVRIPMAAEPI